MRCLLPFLLLLTACAAAPRESTHPLREARLGEEFDLELDDTISLAGTPYLLIFSHVIEDSRCPTGVACIAAGAARITIFVSDFSKTDQWPPDKPNSFEIDGFIVTLSTDPRIPSEGSDEHLILEIRRLAPQPKPGVQTEGYRVTLVATTK